MATCIWVNLWSLPLVRGIPIVKTPFADATISRMLAQLGQRFARIFLEAKMYKKILLAYNGSAAGQKALLDSGELASGGKPRYTWWR